ncbi:hypothetical protein B0H10DRAFT_1961120 [Mycena sp. CBHHK59/15]|nr:hypothetical protein B0H10DRAFT_1961120 [Mycena sp. CBHHK59/15]
MYPTIGARHKFKFNSLSSSRAAFQSLHFCVVEIDTIHGRIQYYSRSEAKADLVTCNTVRNFRDCRLVTSYPYLADFPKAHCLEVDRAAEGSGAVRTDSKLLSGVGPGSAEKLSRSLNGVDKANCRAIPLWAEIYQIHLLGIKTHRTVEMTYSTPVCIEESQNYESAEASILAQRGKLRETCFQFFPAPSLYSSSPPGNCLVCHRAKPMLLPGHDPPRYLGRPYPLSGAPRRPTRSSCGRPVSALRSIIHNGPVVSVTPNTVVRIKIQRLEMASHSFSASSSMLVLDATLILLFCPPIRLHRRCLYAAPSSDSLAPKMPLRRTDATRPIVRLELIAAISRWRFANGYRRIAGAPSLRTCALARSAPDDSRAAEGRGDPHRLALGQFMAHASRNPRDLGLERRPAMDGNTAATTAISRARKSLGKDCGEEGEKMNAQQINDGSNRVGDRATYLLNKLGFPTT